VGEELFVMTSLWGSPVSARLHTGFTTSPPVSPGFTVLAPGGGQQATGSVANGLVRVAG
jgi:hypothetical protein